MRKTARDMTEVSLAVQYAIAAHDLPRWRLRHWVKRATAGAQTHLNPAPKQLILTIRIVDEDEGCELNRSYRGRDYATNVLTFNYDQPPGLDAVCQADVVLCDPVLRKEAAEQGKTVLDHAAHLCVHATLHALGFDHEDDEQARVMEGLEIQILARMGLGNPYQTSS